MKRLILFPVSLISFKQCYLNKYKIATKLFVVKMTTNHIVISIDFLTGFIWSVFSNKLEIAPNQQWLKFDIKLAPC